MKKLLLLVLVLSVVLAPAIVSAAQPVTTIVSSNANIQIITFPFEYAKQNTSLYVRWWTFNGTNGVMLKNDSVYCTLNLLEPQGKNVMRAWVQKNFGLPSNPNACQNCFWWDIAAGNFTEKGQYGLNIRCQTYDNKSLGGDVMTPIRITGTGIEPATGGMIVFAFIIFVLLTVGMIYCAIMCLSGFVGDHENPGKPKGVKIEWVIANICIFIISLIFVWFNDVYFGVVIIKDMMSWYIDIGAFTNVLIPLIAYIVSITVIQLLNIQKKKEEET